MKTPPKIRITLDGLDGWDEFHRWAKINLLEYLEASMAVAHLDEGDRLRALAYLAVTRLLFLQATIKDVLDRNPKTTLRLLTEAEVYSILPA